MTSILTNAGAISALQTLRSINSDMETTQGRVSSGLRVQDASDNAAYWSIATTMTSDNKALSAVEDALGLGAAAVDVAYAGMSASLDVVDEIKARLVAAREPGVDKLKINKEITEFKKQIYSIVESSTFAGQNWLHRFSADDDVDKEIVGSFTRDASGNVSIQTVSYGMANQWGTNHLIDENYHNGILTNVEFARELGTAQEWVLVSGKHHAIHQEIELGTTTSESDIDDMISVIDAMLAAMTDAVASLGAIGTRVSMQENFMADLRDTIDKGIGRLVDADMNEASTRLKALQTQEQLGIQALQIANSNSENILSLFR